MVGCLNGQLQGLNYQQIISVNKISNMYNTHLSAPRGGPMNASSIVMPTTHQEPRKSYGFAPSTSTFDPHKPREINDKNDPNTLGIFPKAMLSSSMIDMNSTSNRRVGFGKLDSMARKVTPTFQDESLHQQKPVETHNFPHDNPAQSMMMISKTPTMGKKISSTLSSMGHQVEESEGPKKRRESIDIGIASKRQYNSSEILPFMRRMKAPEEVRTQSTHEESTAYGDVHKNKNFQFLKKRREAQQQIQQNNAASLNQAHSLKNLNQNSGGFGFKRPEFSTPTHGNNHKMNTYHSASNIQSPEDRPVEMATSKFQPAGNALQVPSFEFKKKKTFEAPSEGEVGRSMILKDTSLKRGELITMKERMAMKNQRQIKLDDFELMQKLGKGAFGDVYIAQEKTIGLICVIKKMSKKRIKAGKLQQHVLREIKIQSYLSHPNLTSLFGYFSDEEHFYLIMEALPDGSLQNIKKKKKLPQKEAASIVRQAAEGLQHMHEEYTIHRDIKPQNLFMHEGTVKIGDFGCSIYNRDLGLRNTLVGCLQYSSPEQLSQEGYTDKIDGWCLGILTYELLFGKSPFGSDIIKLTQNKQIKPELSTLSFPSGIAIKETTKRFIENLLEGDPDKRMDMDEVLEHQFLREEMQKKTMRLSQF